MYKCQRFSSGSSRMFTVCNGTDDDGIGDGIKEQLWYDSNECDGDPGGEKTSTNNICTKAYFGSYRYFNF